MSRMQSSPGFSGTETGELLIITYKVYLQRAPEVLLPGRVVFVVFMLSVGVVGVR